MDGQGNGLTLEGLAQRLEALERENTELRSKVATLEGSGTRSTRREERQAREKGPHTKRRSAGEEGTPAFDARVGRRSVLSKAGAAAVAAMAAGTLLGSPRQAKAHTATNTIDADTVNAHYIRAVPHENSGRALHAEIYGTSSAVLGWNRHSGAGVDAYSESGSGVNAYGGGEHEAGVKGEGYTGVWGLTSRTSHAGVYGENTGTSGIGTVGIGKGDDTGVLGRNRTGQGLRGEGKYGVVAVGDSTGYGGRFEGGKAQLKLKPAASAGKPTTGTHEKGEIYMDSAGALFVCTGGGTPGTWKKVNMKLI
jgi:hypothetical protein